MDKRQAELHSHDTAAQKERNRRAKAQLDAFVQFVQDEATDPLNYLGVGSGALGKALGKGMFSALMAAKSEDATASVYGRIGSASADKYRELMALYAKLGYKNPSGRAFNETGVYRGMDDVLRKYFPDKGAKLRPEAVERFRSGEETKLGRLMEHPELYSKFPSNYDIPVTPIPENPRNSGFWDPKRGQIASITSRNGKPISDTELLRILLHENQHVLQSRTGLKGGVTASQLLPQDLSEARIETATRLRSKLQEEIEKATASGNFAYAKDAQKQLAKMDEFLASAEKAKKKAFNDYLRSYGELEARTTENWRGTNLRDFHGNGKIGTPPEDLFSMDPWLSTPGMDTNPLLDY